MIQKLVNIFVPQKQKKQKKHILAVSDTFPEWHTRSLESTHFASLIKADSGSPKRKIHDIRTNYRFWEEACLKVNSGNSLLRVCYIIEDIEGMKYHPITLLSHIGIQELLLTADGEAFVDGSPIAVETLAKNEGLSEKDFLEWRKKDKGKKLCIIHFTDYRYLKS